MANKYAYNKEVDEAKTARAMAKSLKISPKHSIEICRAIRGLEVWKAKAYLEDVIEMKKSVPFKRHNKKVGHRKGQEGWAAGRYPVKAAEQILKVLEKSRKPWNTHLCLLPRLAILIHNICFVFFFNK